jgi:hypothetical protein
LVVGGKKGRRERASRADLALGFGFGLGRLGLAKERKGERELGYRSHWAKAAARSPASLGRTEWVEERNFLFYFLKGIKC